tara:strand:- start:357 stop:818 length:462 start_codon:yes stop_codon:yes gene_type:complete
MAIVRPSLLSDVPVVAENMRKEDVDEVKAHTGGCPKGSLLYAYFMSKPCLTVISRHGHLMAMGGVVPEGENIGRIWLLGCQSMFDDSIDKRWFLRKSKEKLAEMQSLYPLLFNMVDARNEVHVNWIRWLGFTFIKKHLEWGPEQMMFYEFVRI